MAHGDHFPTIRRRTLKEGHREFGMFADEYEAHLVTTTYPTKDFVCRVVTCTSPSLQNYQRVFIDALPLKPDDADVVSTPEASSYIASHRDFARRLRTRVLFWNCAGVCPCKFHEAISKFSDTHNPDVLVILGGPAEDERTVSLWREIGREGSTTSNFSGRGPNVTVKWEDLLVDVVATEEFVGDTNRSQQLEVRVERNVYTDAIKYALEYADDPMSSDLSDPSTEDFDSSNEGSY